MTALPFDALCIDELPYDALVGVVKGCSEKVALACFGI